MVEALLKAGAQLEVRDEYGFTALNLAESTGHLNIVKALKKAGEPQDRDENNTTAFFHAQQQGPFADGAHGQDGQGLA